jgi:hypothetical protein
MGWDGDGIGETSFSVRGIFLKRGHGAWGIGHWAWRNVESLLFPIGSPFTTFFSPGKRV